VDPAWRHPFAEIPASRRAGRLQAGLELRLPDVPTLLVRFADSAAETRAFT